MSDPKKLYDFQFCVMHKLNYYNVFPLTHTFRRCMKEYEDAGITVSDKFTTLIFLEFMSTIIRRLRYSRQTDGNKDCR